MIKIIKKKTNTRVYSEEIKEALYPNREDYASGNIRCYDIDIITLDCTEEDINNSLNESVVLRQYFKAEGERITLPVFFTCIEGVHANIADYLRLLETCGNLKNSLVIDNINQLLIKNLDDSNIINVVMNKLENFFNLIEKKYIKYYIRYEKKFDIEMIIKCGEGNLAKYSLELQKYLLNKLNLYINDSAVVNAVGEKYKLRLLQFITNLNDELMIMLNNFNIDKVSPKIILLLEEARVMDKADILLLGYLRYLGVDIVIFSPSGVSNLDLVLKEQVISKIILGYINRHIDYNLLFNVIEYLEKSKVSFYELGEGFIELGYNSTLQDYKNKIRAIKYPILYKINRNIGGDKLIIIGGAGIVTSVVLIIVTLINIFALSISMLIFTIIFFIGLIVIDIK